MWRRVVPLIVALLGSAIWSPAASGTSGWDRHSVDIRARYRIHGGNGVSVVHRLDGLGQCAGPALCGTLDADGGHRGWAIPPDYALTATQLVVRYHDLISSPPAATFFVIDVDTGNTEGPLDAGTLERHLASPVADLSWTTPRTAADRFERWAYGVGLLLAILVLLAARGLLRFLWAVSGADRA